MNKHYFAIAGLVLVALLLMGLSKPQEPTFGGNGIPFFYNSATHATSSVGIYAWSTVLAADSSRGYVSFCNDSIVANSAIYLGLGATSTVSTDSHLGIRVDSGECYEIGQENMFYGAVYGIASTSTSTLLQVKASY